MRYVVAIAMAMSCLLLASPTHAQTKPATAPASAPADADAERAAVVDGAKRYLRALRALDDAAIRAAMVPPDTDDQRKATDAHIWLSIHAARIAVAADRKFGPLPDMGDEDWAFPTEESLERCVREDPMIVDVNGSSAHVDLIGDFSRQSDGRWLFARADASTFYPPSDPKKRAAIDERFKRIATQIDSGRIKSRSEARIWAMGLMMQLQEP